MKLANVHPTMDINMEALSSKDVSRIFIKLSLSSNPTSIFFINSVFLDQFSDVSLDSSEPTTVRYL